MSGDVALAWLPVLLLVIGITAGYVVGRTHHTPRRRGGRTVWIRPTRTPSERPRPNPPRPDGFLPPRYGGYRGPAGDTPPRPRANPPKPPPGPGGGSRSNRST